MGSLLDSRCLAAFLSILTIPWAVASTRYGDTLGQLYADLDSELPALSQLLLGSGTSMAAAAIAVVGALATFVRIGPERASSETVHALQVAIAVTLIGSAVVLEAVAGPVQTLFEKIA